MESFHWAGLAVGRIPRGSEAGGTRPRKSSGHNQTRTPRRKTQALASLILTRSSYVFPNFSFSPFDVFRMYGIGFLFLLIPASLFLMFIAAARLERTFPPLKIVGIQMEFPPEHIIPQMLDKALAKNTNAPIFVLSEYTLNGAVPIPLKVGVVTIRAFWLSAEKIL